jgi:branched-subunit amino acid transport protein
MTDELRDQLPDDLNAVDHVGAYDFPDNSRRRIPGVVYAVLAALCVAVWTIADGNDSPNVNKGLLFAAILLAVMSIITITSGWRMTINESEALVVATRSAGFAVGHASAQQVWRGIRSKPTWRIFCYSTEDPPLQQALVLIDAVNGRVVECLVEKNPEAEMPSTVTSER